MFEGINPTSENIVMKFWEILSPLLKGSNYNLHSIKIYETEKNIVEYRG